MRYVIVRNSDHYYATPPGFAHSYAETLQHARIFTSREAAEKERCGDETIRLLADELQEPTHPAQDNPPETKEPEEESFTVEQDHQPDRLVVRILHPTASFPIARLEIVPVGVSNLGFRIDTAMGNPAVGVACWYRETT